jgi:hypothetical protein
MQDRVRVTSTPAQIVVGMYMQIWDALAILTIANLGIAEEFTHSPRSATFRCWWTRETDCDAHTTDGSSTCSATASKCRSSRMQNDLRFERDTRGEGANAAGVGKSGQAIQDICIAQSMGAISDRSNEHLSAGDVVIVRLRQRLIRAAPDFSEHGTIPPGVNSPQGYRLQQGILQVRPGRTWLEEIKARREGVPV